MAYTLNEYKNGKIKDVAKYLQKMVATSELIIQLEQQTDNDYAKAKSEEQIQHKIKNDAQQQVLQDMLKKEYFEQKINLCGKILNANKNLHTQLLQQLKDDN